MTTEDKIVIIGGSYGDMSYYNDVWSSTDGESWVQVKANNSDGFSARRYFGAAVLKGIIYVVAGDDGNSNSFNDVWSSADGGKTWLQVLANAPFAKRSGLALITFENKFLNFGSVTKCNFQICNFK